MQQSFGAFVLICTLLTITPGADTALVLSSALKNSSRSVLATNLGICAGLLFHATLSALGLSAILTQSANLYSAVKFLGAGYLAYLGLRTLYGVLTQASKSTPVKTFTETETETEERFARASDKTIESQTLSASFRTGLLTNVLNPKVAVFYLTFLPQFVNPAKSVLAQSLLLALVHVGLSFVWLALISRFVTTFRTALTKPQVKSKLEAVTGFALLGFGIKLALSER